MTEPTATAEALNDLRQRYLDGLPWTREELKTAIHTMIGQRLKDVQAAAVPKTKKLKAAAVSLDDMLPGPTPAIIPNTDETVIQKKLAKIAPEPKKPTSEDGFF